MFKIVIKWFWHVNVSSLTKFLDYSVEQIDTRHNFDRYLCLLISSHGCRSCYCFTVSDAFQGRNINRICQSNTRTWSRVLMFNFYCWINTASPMDHSDSMESQRLLCSGVGKSRPYYSFSCGSEFSLRECASFLHHQGKIICIFTWSRKQ